MTKVSLTKKNIQLGLASRFTMGKLGNIQADMVLEELRVPHLYPQAARRNYICK